VEKPTYCGIVRTTHRQAEEHVWSGENNVILLEGKFLPKMAKRLEPFPRYQMEVDATNGWVWKTGTSPKAIKLYQNPDLFASLGEYIVL